VAKVRLNNLVKQYGAFYAVDHVSLTIEHGEFVALVGPSGCGKTTTLNLVAGLQEQSSGDIHIGDRLVNTLDPKDRDIAMVFQNYALYPNKTVFKNLAFPLTMRKMPRADIDRTVMDAAKVLDIVHLLERKPRELSGGQQQRVALGRALVRKPSAFLMDEPLSNLDAKLRGQMRSELKRFHQDQGATVIYVTHDQLEAVTMADRMAVMDRGVLQQYDTPARVFAEPASMFVASFVGSPAMNLLPCDVVVQSGVTLLRGGDGWTIPLSAANARKASGARTSSVVIGARHGTVLLSQREIADAVPGRVYTVEPTGDITYAHITLGTTSLVVSVEPSVLLSPDDPVWLQFDQDRLHLFDGTTEQALKAA
jgi:multiple sugar transport system ATP-binding protein